MNESFEKVYQLLSVARNVVVLTGAGISAESGIPTFRDSLSGLWAKFDPEELATPSAFAKNPALVWGWYEWRRQRVANSSPNAGHLALVGMSTLFEKFQVITQNVDDLHERAGCKHVVHLHGHLNKPRCSHCGCLWSTKVPEVASIADSPITLLEPPRCTVCGHWIRPGVVWFGEGLPHDAWQAAEESVTHADCILSIGTSGMVYPAAGLSELAIHLGINVVTINPKPDGLLSTYTLNGKAGVILPALFDRLRESKNLGCND